MIETSQLITLAVCCGYVSNLIGRRTIHIPEIILGVRGLMGFTVNASLAFCCFSFTSCLDISSKAFRIKPTVCKILMIDVTTKEIVKTTLNA